ncbi:hypothetical protein GGS23DRAFT_94859 [Durotheca rogersii]|uniref:uncharacterized protein n=1 Tax=Durotheca rogersii TaxID=419775 RepID=UPI0022211A7E|nr:uncharacterized protein GGS23DRAFT_94859 [Durotheca rogersii]KAI5862350.1 hypothetical protein GGS23DRAFT_94859 [Durotheca rogersii]
MDPSVPLDQLIPPPTERNDSHKEYGIAIACIILGALGSAFVSARLWYRVRTKTIGVDDYAMIPSFILYLGWTVLTVYAVLASGAGKPLNEITLAEYTIWFQCILAVTWLYPVTSGAIRASIILFYYRIFADGHGSALRASIWVLLALQAVYVVVFSILPAFICRPFSVAWLPIERAPFCSTNYWNAAQVTLYSVSLAFDVILVFFPVVPVSKLKMPLKKRVGVAIMFMLGASASVASAYKLAAYVADLPRTHTSDPHWFDYLMSRFIPVQFDNYGVTVWIPGQLEPTLALLGASLPAVYPLFKSVSGRVATRLSAQHRSSNKPAGSSSGGSGGRPPPRNYDLITFGTPRKFQKLSDSQIELRTTTIPLDASFADTRTSAAGADVSRASPERGVAM